MAGTVAGTASTANTGGATLTPSQFANQTWAALVLTMIGAPITPNNLNNFMSWMTSENGAATWTGTAGTNNPLNNGLGSGGGSGLGSYPDLFTAAVYAAKGLQGGITGGQYIGAALKADAPFPVFHAATLKATWSGDHYAGTQWASATAPYNVPVVTVAQAAQHGSTHGPTVGNVTAADLGNPGLLQQAEQAAASGGTAVEGAAKAVLSWDVELGKLLGDLTSAAWWKRVGVFALGVALIGGGLILFVSTTKTGKQLEHDAGEAATVAAVA